MPRAHSGEQRGYWASLLTDATGRSTDAVFISRNSVVSGPGREGARLERDIPKKSTSKVSISGLLDRH